MHQLLAIIAACLLLALPARAANEGGELVFGIYPYLSSSQTVELFAPLGDHLARTLGRPVSLRSAPDFARFIERTRAGEYDIVFTAPHMGRLAEQRDRYQPVAQTGYQIVIVALTRKESPLRKLADLKGRSLAIGARLSMTYQIVDQELGKHGLALGRDVKFVNTANFSNVLDALVLKEADAGATGTLLWDKAPAEKKEVLRELWRSQPVPGFLMLAAPRVDAATLQRLKQGLFDFNSTPAGKTYFDVSQQTDFRPVDAATMKRIDPFTAVLEKP